MGQPNPWTTLEQTVRNVSSTAVPQYSRDAEDEIHLSLVADAGKLSVHALTLSTSH